MTKNLPVFPSCLRFSSLVSEDGSGLSLDILLIYLKVKNNTPNYNHVLDFSKKCIDFGWELGHTISDGVCLHLLVRAGLAHS